MRTTIFSRMNKLPLMLCLAALFVCLAANAAFARSGWYITPKLGINIMEAEAAKINDTTYHDSAADGTAIGFGVASGYDFSAKNKANLRLEVEAMFRTGISDDRDLLEYNAHTFLFNAFYDFRNSSKFTPYIGAGLGFSIITLEFDNVEIWYNNVPYYSDDSGAGVSFAAHAGLGCYFELSERFGLDLGYRYMYLGNSNVDIDLQRHGTETWEADLSGHEFMLGFRFNF